MYQVNTDLIGKNAGKIWEILQEKNSLTQHQIMKSTALSKEKFNQALGWLARENKIRKEGEFFSLSDTNLTAPIGNTAIVVVSVLQDLGKSVEGLEELTRIQSDEFHQAIGWLAKEGHFQSIDDQVLHTSATTPEDHMLRLQDEIDLLNDEVVSRNHIISELTRQLTETQTKYMRNADVIEKLNVQLMKSHQHISSAGEHSSESIKRIQFFEDEIRSLHEELTSRNHIICELSRQLTNTQTTIITQADKLERLQTTVGKTPSMTDSTSTSLKKRLHRITKLQESLDTNQQSPLMSETKLYDKHSPVLDLTESQSISDEDLREALQGLHEEINEKITQKKPRLDQES